ncbi:MAG TPA: glycosyltransferase family 9 protein [Gammaproteobacteria bacterium]|nr:glycosyltransferase family 9 protein [Gammaproteobacteria bacterium]
MKKFFKSHPPRILLSRVDNIGDVILTLPMASVLKQHYPDCHIVFMARDYVRDIIRSYPMVDEFLSWNELESATPEQAAKRLKQLNLDLFVHVYPKEVIAKLAAKAKIPYRVGTIRRTYHYFNCNRWVPLRRNRTNLHEAQLNLQLLTPFGIKEKPTLEQLIPRVKLTPPATPLPLDIAQLLDKNRFNLIVHPLSNNNGKEWPLAYYIQLINSLPPNRFNVFVTGSTQEVSALTPLISQCQKAHVICGKLDLAQFLTLIQQCDGLLASGTGPLHMAAAIGIKALGLYPPPMDIDPVRWGPLGPQAEFLVKPSSCFKRCLHPGTRSCPCMDAISVAEVRSVLERWASIN